MIKNALRYVCILSLPQEVLIRFSKEKDFLIDLQILSPLFQYIFPFLM